MLRLDASDRVKVKGPVAQPDFTKTDELGNVEEAVISKWAGEDVGGAGEDEEEGSEEEDDE